MGAGLAQGFLAGFDRMDRFQRNNRQEERQKQIDERNDKYMGLQMQNMEAASKRNQAQFDQQTQQNIAAATANLNQSISDAKDQGIDPSKSELVRNYYNQLHRLKSGVSRPATQEAPQEQPTAIQQQNRAEIQRKQQMDAKAKAAQTAAMITDQAHFLQNGGNPNDPEFRERQQQLDSATYGTPLSAIKFKPEYRGAVDRLSQKLDDIENVDPSELTADLNVIYQENLATKPFYSDKAVDKKISNIEPVDGKSFKFEIQEHDADGNVLNSYYMQDPQGGKGDTTIEIENAMGDLAARKQAIQSALTAPKEYANYMANRDLTRMQAPEVAQEKPSSLVHSDDLSAYLENGYVAPKKERKLVQAQDRRTGQTIFVDANTGKEVSRVGGVVPLGYGGRRSSSRRAGKATAPKTMAEAANNPEYQGGFVGAGGRPIEDKQAYITQDIKDIAERLLSADLSDVSGTGGDVINPFSYSDANQDLKNDFLQLKNLLTKDNLGILKGSISDADMAFLSRMSSGLNMDEEGYVKGNEKAIKRQLGNIISRLPAMRQITPNEPQPEPSAPQEPRQKKTLSQAKKTVANLPPVPQASGDLTDDELLNKYSS